MATIGGVGGAVGALLGGGTGTVTVPALDRLTTMRRAVIHGTVATPNAVVAILGATTYWLRGGAIDGSIAIPMMLGGALGVLAGVRLVQRIPELALRLTFISVLALAGFKLLHDGLGITDLTGWNLASTGIPAPQPVLWALTLVFGTVVGAWSASLGLGGGLLTVPTLVIALDVPMQTALGTSLVVMLPNAVLSVIAHRRNRTSDARTGYRLATGAAPGAIVGALLALAVPSTVLNIIFGSFTVIMAAVETRRLLQRRNST